MAIVRITEIPENRRWSNVDLEMEVRSFRGATAAIAQNLRETANNTFRNQVMRLWSRHGRSGGFAFRNGRNNDSWVLFEYIEKPKELSWACCTSSIGPVCEHRKGL